MRRGLKVGSVVGVLFALVVIVLPQIVVAETQTEVTKVADFKPASDDNDEIRNIANETITTNRDTWSPLPEGIFVGGTIEESKMRLNEISPTYSHLVVTTKVRFQIDYVSSGASQFVVRLPVHVGDDEATAPVRLDLEIYEYEESGSYSLGLNGSSIIFITSSMKLVAYSGDVANLWSTFLDPGNESRQTGMSSDSWVTGGRAYCRMIAPLMTDRDYLLMAEATYAPDAPFDIYWHPSDMASDGITDSRVAYTWTIDPSSNIARNYPVEADAGWSFVFQRGIGGTAIDYDAFYGAYTSISFWKLVPTETLSTTGRVTFIMEFRVNYSEELNYSLDVTWWDAATGVATEVLSSAYWDNVSAKYVVVAGSDTNYTKTGWEVDGQYFAIFSVSLRINNATRLQVLANYDSSLPGYTESVGAFGPVIANRFDAPNQQVFFAPWCTIEIAPYSYNKSYPDQPSSMAGFWAGIGRWWDKHWVDIVGCLLIIAGVALAPLTLGGSLVLIGIGIGMILYNNVDWIRNLVDNFVGMIIDGLEWLGNWLWKIGMAIWKAITWFVDQVIYYGAILIGLLIILVAMFIFIVPVYFEIKILGAFLAMANGDYEKASAQLAGVVSSGKSLIGRG